MGDGAATRPDRQGRGDLPAAAAHLDPEGPRPRAAPELTARSSVLDEVQPNSSGTTLRQSRTGAVEGAAAEAMLARVAKRTGRKLLAFDRKLGGRFVAGADEAGRGPLAG